MFEKATRLKLRFPSQKGFLTVEDLWDLPLTGKVSLDNIAKQLNKEIKESSEESFVIKKTEKNNILELKFELVKYIIKVKLSEIETAEKAKVLKEKKQKIMELIQEKENESLKSKSLEDLQKMLDDL